MWLVLLCLVSLRCILTLISSSCLFSVFFNFFFNSIDLSRPLVNQGSFCVFSFYGTVFYR